jgi:hypothetical protein
MALTHLHSSMEAPLGKYRRCDRAVLLAQIGSETIRRINGTGQYHRIVEAEPFKGDFTMYTVGLLIPLAERHAIRVLYTVWDLYTVELVVYDNATFTVLDSMTEVSDIRWAVEEIASHMT